MTIRNDWAEKTIKNAAKWKKFLSLLRLHLVQLLH